MNTKEKLTSAHEVKALRREPVSTRTLKYRAGSELLASELNMRDVIYVKA